MAEIYKNDWRGVPLEEVPKEYQYHAEMKRLGRGVNTATGIELKETSEDTWTELIDSEIVRRLVATNWIRTACWSLRLSVALALLVSPRLRS